MAALCKSTVLKVYQEVMDDVINNIREMFLEEGVDEQVLQELKQTWETKLLATKAVEKEVDTKTVLRKANDALTATTELAKTQHPAQLLKQVVGQVPPNNHVQTSMAQVVKTKMVPIQITLPPQPGTEGGQRVLTIQVPATALQGNQLHKVLTGPVITATMSLPQHLASAMLQQHVNAALSSQQQILPLGTIVNKSVIQQSDGCADMDGDDNVASGSGSASFVIHKVNQNKIKRNCKPPHNKIKQVDGIEDTSDDDDNETDADDGSDEADDYKDEDEQEMNEGGVEEEPLNSEDDITEEGLSDSFDTDNVIVCQFDKITRCRNKWKFHLKDGIMNLDMQDYVFQRANGEAEW